ncbi:MAG: restriction endonuclease [Armatimonadetes bacterium]|nr:restriction endonuclease [Armatimonadota bacterium]
MPVEIRGESSEYQRENWVIYVSEEALRADQAEEVAVQDEQSGVSADSAPAEQDSLPEDQYGPLTPLQYKLDDLATAVHSRLHNVLTPGEKRIVDNQIRTLLFEVKRNANRLPKATVEQLVAEVSQIECEIQQYWQKEDAQSRHLSVHEPSAVAAMTPSEFEEYVGDVYSRLGHAVLHTGGPGDEGVDIILDEGDNAVVVQCKHRSTGGRVGSADVQKLLGAVHNIRAAKGILVTNGTFSDYAKRFADENPIELVDGVRLAELARSVGG